MRRTPLIVVAAIVSSLTAPAVADITTGLVSHWKLDDGFNNTASDDVGTNAGSLKNGPTWDGGTIAGGLLLDGSNDFVEVSADASHNLTTDVTVAGWFKLDNTFNSSSNDSQVLWAKYLNGDQNMVITLAGTDYSNGSVADGSIVFKIENGTSAHNYTWTTTTTWTAGQWYHFAALMDVSNATLNKVYIDGVDDTAGTSNGSDTTVDMSYNVKITIGGGDADQLSGMDYLEGILDDVRLYSRMLTGSDIVELTEITAPTVLFVVVDPSNLTQEEKDKRSFMNSWGYTVALIDESDSPTNFDAAAEDAVVTYIGEDCNSGTVNTKTTNFYIGVVNDEPALSDELGFSSTYSNYSDRDIDITDNSHYITSGLAIGSLEITSGNEPLIASTGTFAPDMQTLAERVSSSDRALVVLEIGADMQGGGKAKGRRVRLPWGGGGFDPTELTADGQTIFCRSLEWAAGFVNTEVETEILLVVVDPSGLTDQEKHRKKLFEGWGYVVTLIDESDSQANFDAAVASAEVAYIPEEVASGNVGTKLTDAVIGVVNEEGALYDELLIASGSTNPSASSINISDNTHYVTELFSTGALTVASSSQSMSAASGTLAPDLVSLAEWGVAPALNLLEAGGDAGSCAYTAGRRVAVPWGGGTFDFASLNAHGKAMLRRSIEWASDLKTYWKLDDGSGSTAGATAGGLDGTMFGSPVWWTNGRWYDCLSFDHTDDYVQIANDPALQLRGALTIMAWIRGNAWDTGTYVNVIARKGDSDPNNYQLAVADSTVALMLDDTDGNGIRGTTTLNTDEWYHVAATWDGFTVRIYVNGVLDNSPGTARLGTIDVDTRPLYIGGQPTTDLFDGLIDDVRIYGRALTAAEVNAVKNLAPPMMVMWQEVQP